MSLRHFTPKLFSILKKGYSLSDFRVDVLAGLTVAIVALPLSMALSIASGASPDKGLVTAVVAGFLISFLGGSRVQVGGPTGAFVVVVYNVIAQYGYDGLLLATLLAGVILVVAGYAKLGQIIKFIPHPVVTGFTAGIAVIIASSQVKDFLGLTLEKVPGDFIPKWVAYFGAINTTSAITVAIGLGSLATLIILRRIAPKLPGFLIVVIASSVIVALLHLPVDTIGSRFPHIPTGLPAPHWPAWDYEKLRAVTPSAFTIAFLAGIEALLSAVVADSMTGFHHRSNQELVAQGVANIASAFFGALPATGAIARTATNIKSGAKSPVAGISHAVFVLLFMLFAMDQMRFVPMAALAAILFLVAWGMSELGHFIHILKLSANDRAVLLLTFLLTVFVDLTVAIGVGVTMASLLFMAQMSKAVEIRDERNPGPSGAGDDYSDFDEEAQRIDLPHGVEVFRITGPIFFGVANDLLDTLLEIGTMPKVLILRMGLVPYLDASGETVIEDIIERCREAGTTIVLAGAQPQPRLIFANAHVTNDTEGVMFCPDYPSSLALAREIVGRVG